MTRSIIFYRSKETGEVLNVTAAHPEGAQLQPLDRPAIWKSNPLTVGTPEYADLLDALADAWSNEHNKRFKLPISLAESIAVTYDECAAMMCILHQYQKDAAADA